MIGALGRRTRRSEMPDDIHNEARSRWEALSQTGAGTPMGELLRRYWWPIAGAS